MLGYIIAIILGGVWAGTVYMPHRMFKILKHNVTLPDILTKDWVKWHELLCIFKAPSECKPSLVQEIDATDLLALLPGQTLLQLNLKVSKFLAIDTTFYKCEPYRQLLMTCCSFNILDRQFIICGESENQYLVAVCDSHETPILGVFNKNHCIVNPYIVRPYPIWISSRQNSDYPDHFHFWLSPPNAVTVQCNDDEVPYWDPENDPVIRETPFSFLNNLKLLIGVVNIVQIRHQPDQLDSNLTLGSLKTALDLKFSHFKRQLPLPVFTTEEKDHILNKLEIAYNIAINLSKYVVQFKDVEHLGITSKPIPFVGVPAE